MTKNLRTPDPWRGCRKNVEGDWRVACSPRHGVAGQAWLSGYGVAGKAVYVADTKCKITADG